MITNEQQYHAAKVAVEKFQRALEKSEQLSDQKVDVHPLLRKAQEDAIRSQLSDLVDEIEEYELRQQSTAKVLHLDPNLDLNRQSRRPAQPAKRRRSR